MPKVIEECLRVFLLTDSLGCPREETPVLNTWVDKIVRSMGNYDLYFYTFCNYGLNFKHIPSEYIKEVNPDILIVQLGVVDACRRALPIGLERVIYRIPVLSRVIRSICKRYHYTITKILNIHYTSREDIRQICLQLIERTNSKICFIAIAPSGSTMKKKTYRFEKDVEEYNSIFRNIAAEYNDRVCFLNPYVDTDPDCLFISDGHHLNNYGMDLCYKAVKNYLNTTKSIINGRDI